MKLRRPYVDRVYFCMFGLLMLSGAISAAYVAATVSIGWFGLLLFGAAVLAGAAVAPSLLGRAVLSVRVDLDPPGLSVLTA